jgi:hypothetical protein
MQENGYEKGNLYRKMVMKKGISAQGKESCKSKKNG